MNLQCSMQFDR